MEKRPVTSDDANEAAARRDAPPDSATYDPIERRRFGPVGVVPSSRWVTVALCLGFVGLLVYAISTGNAVSVVGVVVIGVFIGLPLAILTIVNHGRFLPPPIPTTAPRELANGALADDTPSADGSANVAAEREPLAGAFPARLLDESHPSDGRDHQRHSEMN